MTADDVFHRYYDIIYGDKAYAVEAETALKLAGIHDRGARILDIGCGTGNHAIACAGSGHTVVGVDIDEQMIQAARAKLRALPPSLAERIQYLHCPVERLPHDKFDLAIAMFNVVNYLPSLPALHSFMGAVASRLEGGAAFVFDAWNGVAAVRDPPRTKTSRAETETEVVDVVVSSKTTLIGLRTELTYHIEITEKTGGSKTRGLYSFSQTLWPPKVLSDAAEMAGLEVVGVHPCDDTERTADEKDWKMLFICRRRPR